MRTGFDTEKYLKIQKEAIEQRLSKFTERLYLEFGGKLTCDFHAVRTLPGYDANAKMKLLKSLNRELGVIYCVSAKQLVDGKIRGDMGIGYDQATLRAIDDLKNNKLTIEGIVINRYQGQKTVDNFIRQLEYLGLKVYKRREISGYPKNLKLTLSDKGFGADDYLPVKNKLIVVWGSGPGSGKLSTCLGQIYHESKMGLNSGYAKFETFPVWDLPLKHPVNLAYEAATADLGDYNLIDPFHKKAYGIDAVNYNRDVEAFLILKQIFKKMLNKDNYSYNYQSPTDMGFNRLSSGIIDQKIIEVAAKKEVAFYWFRYQNEYKKGLLGKDTLMRMKNIMKQLNIDENYLPTVDIARKVISPSRPCGTAIELKNGLVITGKRSKFLHSESAAILNAVKVLAEIDDKYNLISPSVIKEIYKINKKIGSKTGSLDASETMMAWAVSARDNPLAKKAIKSINKLNGCFIHTTHRCSEADMALFRKLGMWLSTDGQIYK